ncbi:MAG: ABC transporter permease [Elioraea sp.]|nr:ABC transporter permease [Elioraea sp.]MDW8444379.1 ABC transporter permease [Acetobacteraceae bacterium]
MEPRDLGSPAPWRRLLASRSFAIGGVLLVAIALAAVFAPVLAPYDPLRGNFRLRLSPPGPLHWLGTDHFGRDILSRLLFGARLSLAIGAATTVASGLLGALIGAPAGYFRRLDEPLMRLMDALMAFPAILLAMAIAATLGASVGNVIIALAIATTPHTARVVRASVLVVRELEFVEAARSIGATETRILLRHVLLNCLGPLIVRLTYVFAIAVLAEAALSYIGVGPPPPAPSFGNIIAGGRDFLVTAPWITIAPGSAIIAIVLALNLLGDGLRDVLDPRLRI